jgi:hypothetical protein
MDHAKVGSKRFSTSLQNERGGLEQSVFQMNVKRCVETINKYPDLIVGIKTAHY